MPWCKYIAAQEGVEPQLYADSLKCVSGDPDLLLRAARFTTGYVRLVGQEPASSKCVLLSTSRAVRKDMKDWVLHQEGDKWSVKFDVRDLGRHLRFPRFLSSARSWSVDRGAHIQAFTLFRLKITVGCPPCTCPSIRVCVVCVQCVSNVCVLWW